jgi:hypothetical protein
MVKNISCAMVVAAVMLSACCDDYVYLRMETQGLGCDVKEITNGSDGPLMYKGTSGHIERRSDTAKGTTMRFEVTCGADIKRYTLVPICVDLCDKCRGDSFEGEIAYVGVSPRGFYTNRSDCVLGANSITAIIDNGGYISPDPN